MSDNQLIDYVGGTITQMQKDNGLVLPSNYSVSNALQTAYLMLADRAAGPSFIDKMERGEITKISVVRSLQDMVLQGLSPVKNQGYFIQYGNQLSWSRSYFGSVAIVERQPEVAGKPIANVVYEGDTLELGTDDMGRVTVEKFEHSFANQDNAIIGAWARINFVDGHSEFTIMTKKEIDQSWSHRKNRGKVQQEFPQEMAKRTVLSRAAKFVINTSSDNDLVIESVNRTTAQENDFDDDNRRRDVTPAADTNMLHELMATDQVPEEQPDDDQPHSEVQEVINHDADTQDQPTSDVEPATESADAEQVAETEPITQAEQTQLL